MPIRITVNLGQWLPINSVQIIVRYTPNDLPESAEAGHSPFVPEAAVSIHNKAQQMP